MPGFARRIGERETSTARAAPPSIGRGGAVDGDVTADLPAIDLSGSVRTAVEILARRAGLPHRFDCAHLIVELRRCDELGRTASRRARRAMLSSHRDAISG